MFIRAMDWLITELARSIIRSTSWEAGEPRREHHHLATEEMTHRVVIEADVGNSESALTGETHMPKLTEGSKIHASSRILASEHHGRSGKRRKTGPFG